MKGTILATLVVLGLVIAHVTAVNLEHLFDDEGDLQTYLDEEAVDDVLAASWFSHAIHNVGAWTKKAAHDAGEWTAKAAHDVGGAVKKGCGVVNSLPFKELVMRRNEALRKRGISEDQAGLYAGYQGLKQVCRVVG